jgi:hypothetical protein
MSTPQKIILQIYRGLSKWNYSGGEMTKNSFKGRIADISLLNENHQM